MISRVCFDAFHSDKLHLLIEVQDADRASFLGGYRGLHIAFPFCLFAFGPSFVQIKLLEDVFQRMNNKTYCECAMKELVEVISLQGRLQQDRKSVV